MLLPRLELKRTVGSEPALNALIQVYKMYYPDVIIDDPGTFRRGIFAVWFPVIPYNHYSNICTASGSGMDGAATLYSELPCDSRQATAGKDGVSSGQQYRCTSIEKEED